MEAGDRGLSNTVLAASQLVAFVCGEKEPSHGLLARLQAVGGALALGKGSGCLGPRVLRLLAHRLPCRGGLERADGPFPEDAAGCVQSAGSCVRLVQ